MVHYEAHLCSVKIEIGKLVREIRLRNNFTQIILSENIDMSSKQLRIIEYGRGASLWDIMKLFYYLSAKGYLMEEEEGRFKGLLIELLH
ncbi:hypothetical protein [Bacteroides sp. 224]|uniref:hypothetical protein n=1 Tax=Bacteroides sp. 224 TaxID=2302936 RepID=UPI0013D4A53B|nr:hypothetical protein [Bacteroides sp. 224]NDV66413.1 hypothetical protein [Bacteroides sp. 224]